jgi:hypothetical protein
VKDIINEPVSLAEKVIFGLLALFLVYIAVYVGAVFYLGFQVGLLK